MALTVDHGLRAGAQAEARAVGDWCAAHQVPHEILTWTGDKPSSGVQAAARAARYRLLINACHAHNIGHLLVAHTRDDQAETVFMRLKRGSGVGLSGMAVKTPVATDQVADPITLVRPLLTTARRADMAAYADAHQLPVVHDPSNDDEQFERVQVRALLAALAQQNLLSVGALEGTAQRTADLAADRRWRLADAAQAGGLTQTSVGSVRVTNATDPLHTHLMGCFGQPGRGAIPIPPTDGAQVTAGGAVCERDGDQLVYYREPASVLGRADGTRGLVRRPVENKMTVWDGRFVLSPPPAGPAVELGDHRPGSQWAAQWAALGQLLPPGLATSTRARREIATLPCIVGDRGLTHAPKGALDAICDALDGWKGARDFLTGIHGFETRSLFEDRFAARVIRY